MQIGLLRKRVTFQTRNTATDAYGAQVNTWVDLVTVYASIEPLSGGELYAAQSVQSEVSHNITVRYRPELAVPKIVAAMRVVYGTRIFNLQASINTEERNRHLTIKASEGLNNGQ